MHGSGAVTSFLESYDACAWHADFSALFKQSTASAVQKLRDRTGGGSAQALAPAVPHVPDLSALFSWPPPLRFRSFVIRPMKALCRPSPQRCPMTLPCCPRAPNITFWRGPNESGTRHRLTQTVTGSTFI